MNNDWVRLLTLDNERKIHWARQVLENADLQYQFLVDYSLHPSPTEKSCVVCVPPDNVINTLSVLERHGLSIKKNPFPANFIIPSKSTF